MPDSNAKWSCRGCGFHVFNRRYPRCESCGIPLPESLMLSSAELEVLASEAIASVDSQIEDARRSRVEAAALRQSAQMTTSDAIAFAAVVALISGSGSS
jgi:hypothetical protein